MKPIFKALLFLLFSAPFALQPTLSHAHGGGGGGGDSGGGGSDGGDSEVGGRPDANPEQDKAPEGFANTPNVARTYAATPINISPVQLQLLESQGYVSETDQRERGDKDWSSRASKKSQSQWGKHSAIAYDVAAKVGGVSLADVNAMSAQNTNSNVSQSLANAAWSMASEPSNSIGEGVGSGLGGAIDRGASLNAKSQSVSLKNLAKK